LPLRKGEEDWRKWEYKVRISELGPQFLALLESDVFFVPPTGGLQGTEYKVVSFSGRVNWWAGED
jgi:hypothetical protein